MASNSLVTPPGQAQLVSAWQTPDDERVRVALENEFESSMQAIMGDWWNAGKTIWKTEWHALEFARVLESAHGKWGSATLAGACDVLSARARVYYDFSIKDAMPPFASPCPCS